MELIITLRKEVADQPEGESLYEFVKQKLEPYPDVQITGMVNNHFVEEPEH